MGSPCEINLYCDQITKAKKITQLLLDEINRLEDKYTRYKDTSVTSEINNSAGSLEGVKTDKETTLLINYAESLYQQSDGLFDITSGVLRKAWNFKSGVLPTRSSIDDLLPLVGWNKLKWDNSRLILPFEGMEIDFGGFVKEYTADVLAAMCMDHGITQGLINLGGDLKVIGPHPDGSPWRVGIQHPRKPATAIATVDILSGGLATSGDYERYMLIDGKRYSHLLNPKTGKSIQPHFSSISVICEACLLAGSFSSIAMLKSYKDEKWLGDTGLSFLSVDQSLHLGGTLT